MSATPERMSFVLVEYRRATVESATIAAQYGKAARESDDPVPTHFDSVVDAQAVATERLALLGVARRRFQVRGIGLDEAMALDLDRATIARAQFVDSERGVDLKMICGDVGFDFARQVCEFTTWG